MRLGLVTADDEVVIAALEAGDKSWSYSKVVRSHEVSVDAGLVPTTTHKSRGWDKIQPE